MVSIHRFVGSLTALSKRHNILAFPSCLVYLLACLEINRIYVCVKSLNYLHASSNACMAMSYASNVKFGITTMFKQGDFFIFFMYCIQHCLIFHPKDSTMSEDVGIEPRTDETLALEIRRSYHNI